MNENGETLNLTNIDTGRTINPSIINVEGAKEKSHGEVIKRVKVFIEKGKVGKTISLIVKQINNLVFSNDDLEMKQADLWIKKWRQLRVAGIPVVNTVRRVSDNEVAMTDLEADGSAVYGKADVTTKERKAKDLDSLIHNVDLGELQKRAMQIADAADKAGLLLAEDDALSLVMHPNGEWELLALDIGLSELKEDFLKEAHPLHLKNSNQNAVKGIIHAIKALQKKIDIPIKSEVL